MKKLTTTSYAILSLLTIRDWSAYELTQQMHRNVGLYWPRAERGIYDEVKNLVQHRLADVDEQAHGRRPRSVYRISSAGRLALREWLATPVAMPMQIESETLLRVAFAENGRPEDLSASVAALRAQTAQQAALIGRIAEQYLTGEGPYPERLHVITLVMRFFLGHLEACEQWAEWAAAEIAAGPEATTPPGAGRARETLAGVAVRAAELAGGPRPDARAG